MKQMEAHEVAIGENTYYIRPLPAMKAANISTEIAGVAGPLLAGVTPLLGTLARDEDAFLDTDIKDVAGAVSEAFTQLSGDKLEDLLKKLLIVNRNVSVEIPGERAQLLTEDLVNEIFCEDVQDMFILAFNVIKLNYNGFFAKLASRYGSVAELMKKMTETQSENTAN